MAASLLGAIRVLKPEDVDKTCLERLRYHIKNPPRAPLFDCAKCGAERAAKTVDPGVLMFKDLTCQDVRSRCQEPPRPKPTKRAVKFCPGSLVFAAWEQGEHRLWPGIIEDPPDSNENYMVAGKSAVRAYFVTLIFPKEDCRWMGGFVPVQDVHPLEKPGCLPFGLSQSSARFQAATELAYSAVPRSLKERLLRFSFIAYVASQRGFSLDDSGYLSSFWTKIVGKRKTGEGESAGASRRDSMDTPGGSTEARRPSTSDISKPRRHSFSRKAQHGNPSSSDSD